MGQMSIWILDTTEIKRFDHPTGLKISREKLWTRLFRFIIFFRDSLAHTGCDAAGDECGCLAQQTRVMSRIESMASNESKQLRNKPDER